MDGNINGHEFEQAQGHNERQGSLVHCGLWGYKESDTTEQLNNSYIQKLFLKIKTA